jgi:heptaprenylglyceryl phosphate synthase
MGVPADLARPETKMFLFDHYVPLLDPDKFKDIAFYQELEKIGFQQILLGGTGAADLPNVSRRIRQETKLKVILYPTGPDSVTSECDVIVLPDVMNTNSPQARPFGTGPVATAMNIATRKLDYVRVAYFIMGNSTARWYFDAFLVPQPKLIAAYANYARMNGYPYLALDYEDPNVDIDPKLIQMLKSVIGDMRLVVSDEFTPARAREALELGASTVFTSSNQYENATDPLALAAEYYAKLLR